MQRYYPNLAQLPSDSGEIPHWMRWAFVSRGDKLSKVPVSPATASDASTWSTLAVAESYLRKYWRAAPGDREDGLGFGLGAYGADRNFVGIDLDGSIERFKIPARGQPVTEFEVSSWARPIVDEWPGYLEISPSGRGLKGIGLGRLGAEWQNLSKIRVSGLSTWKLEIYGTGRFFTLTGLRLVRTPRLALVDVQDAIDSICLKWGTQKPNGGKIKSQAVAPPVSDEMILQAFLSSRGNGAENRNLFDLPPNESDDNSRVDQKLMNKLAYWCDRHIETMVRLFLKSARSDRLKNGKPVHLQFDYLNRTAIAAINFVSNHFGWSGRPARKLPTMGGIYGQYLY